MYTWGDIVNTTLAKLDFENDDDDSYVQTLISRFAYFANEAMTQICASIKPKYTYYSFDVKDNNYEDDIHIGDLIKMPDDFISFGDDRNIVSYVDPYGCFQVEYANDCDFDYAGNNHIICKRQGNFKISYNARWIDNFVGMDNSVELDVPRDILDCLPSYIASQCMKIDDEYKASVYRNEYEIFLARIDNTHYKNVKTIEIEGDW